MEDKSGILYCNNKAQNREQSFSLTFSWELPVQKLGGRFPNTIELASWLVLCTVLCEFKVT